MRRGLAVRPALSSQPSQFPLAIPAQIAGKRKCRDEHRFLPFPVSGLKSTHAGQSTSCAHELCRVPCMCLDYQSGVHGRLGNRSEVGLSGSPQKGDRRGTPTAVHGAQDLQGARSALGPRWDSPAGRAVSTSSIFSTRQPAILNMKTPIALIGL